MEIPPARYGLISGLFSYFYSHSTRRERETKKDNPTDDRRPTTEGRISRIAEDMEVVDHYVILGLPSGEEGAKLTEIDIKKAYRLKALELHPDKNRDDPNAHDKFQNLKSSYEILKDEKARKLFDDLLRVKRDQLQRQSQYNVKRRKMMSDLEERERASFAPDHTYKSREEEERIVKKLQEEITRIRAMHAKGTVTPATTAAASEVRTSESANSGEGLDKEKALKVSWEGDSEYYSDQRLREVFGEFGEIEDIVIHFKGSRKKKRGSALVVMTSKDAAVAAMSCVCGDLSNPLLVLPVSEKAPPHFSGTFSAKTYDEPVDSKLNNLVGARYQAKEDSILEKLRKKAAENNSK